jgi:hypothetical protein
MQMGQTRVLGASASPGSGAVRHRQNIFEAVRSWAWTSIPMTVSQVAVAVMTVACSLWASGIV